jgi:nucleoside-diphosphate-sugar epimerase
VRILVTGGAGFIGSHLAIRLQELGHEVVVLDNLAAGRRENLKDFAGEICIGDVRSKKALDRAGKVGIVFHEAAITSELQFDPPLHGVECNIMGFLNLLEFVKQNGAKLIYASSSAVVPKPLNFYGATKAATELLAEIYHKTYELPIIGLRYFNTFGAREGHKGRAASMVSQFLCTILKDEQPILWGDGSQSRDFIYVKDAVEASILAMNSNAGCDIFEIGTGKSISYNELIGRLNRFLGKNIKSKYAVNPLRGYQYYTKAETGKAESVLGFKAKYDLEEGLKDAMGYMEC